MSLTSVLGVSLLWVVALAAALAGSEFLVRTISRLGFLLGWSAGVLGLLVALGADSPEITSALVATMRGASDTGLGVVLGSNTYNLAGLLGLSALLGGGLSIGRRWITAEAIFNGAATVVALVLVYAWAPHLVAGVLLLGAFLLYVLWLTKRGTSGEAVANPGTHAHENTSAIRSEVSHGLVLMVLGSAVLILVGSYVLVQSTLVLAPRFGIPHSIVGTFILAIATSLPNTWAAVSLSRRGQAAEAISATFNSNSINLAMGAGLPSLFLAYHISTATRVLDIGWLLGMTGVAVVLLAVRHTLSKLDGVILLGLYVAFVAVRLLVFG